MSAPTLNEFRSVHILIALVSALFGSCFASLLLIAFFGDRILNLFCGA